MISSHSKMAECDSCGTVFELDDNRTQFVNQYSQADDAWGRKDFDEAIKVYQQIVDEDYSQSEAHWGVALCRYGIAYELDPVKLVEMPTCNRINRDSILNDKNYLAAIKYAGDTAKQVYIKRAQEIDRISKEFLKIVDKEKPYDVFISYKRNDAEGRRTIDSQIAKRLYLFLTQQNINVFFAEETLRDIGGERYEPYIFAALNSAKVMILLGSSKENINATWVKNEWRRFLILSENDPSKVLIPVYIGKDPYKIMPQELLSIQAYDAASPVFHEEITENVKKKIGAKAAAPKAGSSLEERYAPKEKVAKLLSELDCEEQFAVDVLIRKQGNVNEAKKYICEDSAYQRSLWTCVECGTKNTHDICRNENCRLSKSDSNRLVQMKQADAERAKKKSREYKRKRQATVKNALKVAGILAVLFALVFVVYNYIIYPNQSIKDGNYYTPEIVQTYCTASSTDIKILTITQCSEDGQVTGTWEFIKEGTYGKIELVGNIVDKKNNGNVTISWTTQTPQILPEGITWENLGNAKVSNSWKKIKADGSTLRAGTSSQLEDMFLKTPADLQKLSNSGGFFLLANDIDMSGVSHNPIEGFTGTLAGNGHSITNLTIELDSSNVGLFSTLDGSVNNLKIENASITANGRNENVGILCGTLAGNVNNVTVSGTVTAEKCANAGGIAGLLHYSSEHSFLNLTNEADITALNKAGGIFGCVEADGSLTMDTLSNSGSITAIEDYAGGIAAYLDDINYNSHTMEVYDCTNTGSITSRYYAGGILGYFVMGGKGSIIENCSCAANLTADAYIGCIAGKLNNAMVSNCQNVGSTLTVEGSITEDGTRKGFVGGFIGVGYCLGYGSEYGLLNLTNEVAINYTGGGREVGGIVGVADGTNHCKNLTNNAPVSGADRVGGIAGYLSGDRVSVEACYNNASITASGDYAGGIIAYFTNWNYNSVYMYDCVNSAKIKGKSYVGGMVGYGKSSNGSLITGCENTGTISGNSKTGQIIGENNYGFTVE